MIRTENEGSAIARSNYWQTEAAQRGYYYISPNAGVIRLLVPHSRSAEIAEMQTAEEVIITRGLHRTEKREMTEFLFDDHSQIPFCLYLSLEQWERLPNSSTDYNRTWEFTAWEDRRCTPHRVLTKICFLRRATLPCMKSWG